MHKLLNEFDERQIETAVALIPHRHDAAWFRETVWGRAPFVCFLDKRVRFYIPGEMKEQQSSPTFPSTLAIYCQVLTQEQKSLLDSIGKLVRFG